MKRATLALVTFAAALVGCAVVVWGFHALFEILPKWIVLPLAIVACSMWFRWFLKDIIKAAIKEAWEE